MWRVYRVSVSSCSLMFHWSKPVRWPSSSQFWRELHKAMNTGRCVSLEATSVTVCSTMIPDFLQSQHMPIYPAFSIWISFYASFHFVILLLNTLLFLQCGSHHRSNSHVLKKRSCKQVSHFYFYCCCSFPYLLMWPLIFLDPIYFKMLIFNHLTSTYDSPPTKMQAHFLFFS